MISTSKDKIKGGMRVGIFHKLFDKNYKLTRQRLMIKGSDHNAFTRELV